MENLPVEIEEIINIYKYQMEHIEKFSKSLDIIKNMKIKDYYGTAEIEDRDFERLADYTETDMPWGLQHYREIRKNGKDIIYVDSRHQNLFIEEPEKYKLSIYEVMGGSWRIISRELE